MNLYLIELYIRKLENLNAKRKNLLLSHIFEVRIEAHVMMIEKHKSILKILI